MERFVDPTPDFPHGKDRGYSRGCRCDDCTEAHRLHARDTRANRRARQAKEPPPPRGHMEKTVRRELKESSDCNPPWVQTLHALAIMLAQQIDRAAEGGKESVISPLTARLTQVLDRIKLAAPSRPGPQPAGIGDEAEDFVNGLTPMG